METETEIIYYDKNFKKIRNKTTYSNLREILMYEQYRKNQTLEYVIYYHRKKWETKESFDESGKSIKKETYKAIL